MINANFREQNKVKAEDYVIITLIILGLIAMYFLGQISQLAFGATFIGIVPSESCKASVNCTSMQELEKTYDNTNQYLSGKFDYDKFGNYGRQPSKFKNHWNFYKFTNQVLLVVDPDAKWTKNLNYKITIVPSEFVYFDRSNMTKKGNTLEQFHDRYVNSCINAVVYYKLLQDTLNYILSNCQVTEFNEKEIVYFPPIPINYSDHKWYKYTEWLKQAKQDCKNRC